MARANTPEDRNLIERTIAKAVRDYSTWTRKEIEDNEDLLIGRIKGDLDMGVSHNDRRLISCAGAIAAAQRELEYRRVRADGLRTSYGLQAGTVAGAGQIEELYTKVLERTPGILPKDRERLKSLATRIANQEKRLGIDFLIDEVPNGNERGVFGKSWNRIRIVSYYLDTMTMTSVETSPSLATVLLHEMIHQVTTGSLYLVERGRAEGTLTPKQIAAANTIFEIYDKVRFEDSRFKEYPYGLYCCPLKFKTA